MATTEKLVEELAKLFNEHKVEYVIIGAVALPVYGYVRTTIDCDIFIQPTEENAKKTIAALKQFGYDVIEETSLENFMAKKTLIRQYSLETDIHPFVKGVKSEDLWKNKIRAKIGDTFVYFPSIEDMIKMKKAVGRVKDKEDLKYLTAILKRKKKK
jgi:predicted nucleotidyltransferase